MADLAESVADPDLELKGEGGGWEERGEGGGLL